MSAFPEAVEQIARDVFAPLFEGDAKQEHLLDPKRRAEAEGVARCAERFADYELEPPEHGRGLGRYGPGSLTPPLGQLISAKKIAGLSAEEFTGLRGAITDALAVGYAGFAALEAGGEGFEPSPDVDPQKVWRLWVVRLYSDELEQAGAPKDYIDDVRGIALDRFNPRLRDLGLMPKIRKRIRFQLISQHYGQCGMMLRFIQSTEHYIGDLSNDMFQLTNTWPFEP